MFLNRIVLELVLGLASLTYLTPRIPAATDWVAGYDQAQEASEQKTYSAYVHELPRVQQWLRFLQAYGYLNPGAGKTRTRSALELPQQNANR